MTPLLALTVSAALSTPAALPPPAPVPLVIQAERRFVATAAERPAAARTAFAARGDSLRNGAAIGAVIGGVGLGGFVGWLCHALDETEGSGDCVKAALLYAAIGAGGGAAVGAGLDALFDRPMAVVRFRF